jgi:hypothetical protein
LFHVSASSTQSDEPSLKEALEGLEMELWKAAIDAEVAALMEMGVIEPMDQPKGGALVGSKMVLKKKRGPLFGLSSHQVCILSS